MSETFRNRLLLVVALALAAVYLFPLYWMYITALKTGSEMFRTPPSFWPDEPQWAIFPFVFQLKGMARFLWNSLVIASGSVALIAVLGTGAAYVLARYRNVARAWLVRKQLREFPRRRADLLFVEMPGLEPDEGLALCHRLENSLSMPGPMLVMDADEASSPEELKRHAAEPVFVR